MRIDFLAQRGESEGAVHRAGVDVRNVELAGDHAAGRRLADARRTVDGYDELSFAVHRWPLAEGNFAANGERPTANV